MADITARKPLDITRLTPLQLGLAIASLVLVVAVAAVLIMGFSSASAARDVLRSGYLFTDLGNIQRGAYELHLATLALLDEGMQRFDNVHLQYALLSSLVDLALRDADSTPTMTLGLGKLRTILAEYDLLMLDLREDTALLLDVDMRNRLLDVLVRFERSAQSLYDREETRFFQRVSKGLDEQRTSNVLLLLMSVCAAVFSTLLALSLNHSIRFEFERAYSMLETLFRADEELHRNVSFEQVGAALVATATEIMRASKAVLFTWDVNRERLIPRVWQGFMSQRIAEQSYTTGDGCLSRVIHDREIVCIEDTLQNPDTLQPLTVEEQVRALVHVPILISEQSFGVLTICFTRPRTVESDERRLLAAMARRAASAIENARFYDLAQASATMQERQRLARELHDAVTQTLFSASLIAEVLPRIWERSPEAGMARLDELRQLTRGALAEMRTLLLELRPQALLEAEMGELFRQLAEAMTGRSRVPVKFDITPGLELEPETKVAFYRIAQEALNNVAKHAHASRVDVSLTESDGQLVLCVADDGRGFDPKSIPPTHLGLGIMQERAHQIGATLEIESEIGRGTRIVSRWSHHEEQRE
jgi:signal transduction histidine kinase